MKRFSVVALALLLCLLGGGWAYWWNTAYHGDPIRMLVHDPAVKGIDRPDQPVFTETGLPLEIKFIDLGWLPDFKQDLDVRQAQVMQVTAHKLLNELNEVIPLEIPYLIKDERKLLEHFYPDQGRFAGQGDQEGVGKVLNCLFEDRRFGGETADDFNKKLAEHGLIILGLYPYEYRGLLVKDGTVRTPNDLAGKYMHASMGSMDLLFIKSLEARSAKRLVTNLLTHGERLDAVVVSPSEALALSAEGWSFVQNYINPYFYTLVADLGWWQSLTEKERTGIERAIYRRVKELSESTLETEQAMFDELAKRGVNVTKLNESELKEWRKMAQVRISARAGRNLNDALINIQARLIMLQYDDER